MPLPYASFLEGGLSEGEQRFRLYLFNQAASLSYPKSEYAPLEFDKPNFERIDHMGQ